MDAIPMAPVDYPYPADSTGTVGAARLEVVRVCLAPRVKSALVTLLEAFDYARDLQTSPWEFAVELSNLRRLKLTDSDLRWLVLEEFAEHVVETTPAGASDRRFRRPERLLLSRRSCFVLSPRGAAFAQEFRPAGDFLDGIVNRQSNGQESPSGAASLATETPQWDRNRLELRVGSSVALRFKIPAAGEASILAVFEENHWPARIDNPLLPQPGELPEHRLQEAVARLNKIQKRPLVRFLAEGAAQGVRWEHCADQA